MFMGVPVFKHLPFIAVMLSYQKEEDPCIFVLDNQPCGHAPKPDKPGEVYWSGLPGVSDCH